MIQPKTPARRLKKRTTKVSQRKIAQQARVSIAAVSFALKNQPGVGAATRARILRVAKDLGYAPDARIASWMARVRHARSKELLPIGWLNTANEKDAWQRYLFHSPSLEGARARALELGYKIDDIWAHEPGMTMQRLARILYQRGIEGVVVTHPARHLRLNWDHLACVTLGTSLLAPRLHRVAPDLNFNLQLALKSLRRLGYQRIGICLGQEIDSARQYSIRALARDFYHNASDSLQIPPLFHPHCTKVIPAMLGGDAPGRQGGPLWEKALNDSEKEKEVVAWLKLYRPQVIVGHDNLIKEWVEAAGYRVPEDVGIVHLAVDDDVLDWAGIHSRRREMGATAVDQLVSLMRNHHFGVPKVPLNILIRGSWQTGHTLASPKTRTQKN